MGNAYEATGELSQWYGLEVGFPGEQISGMDVPMEDVRTDDPSSSTEAPRTDAVSAGDDQGAKSHENCIVSFIDILGRVSIFHIYDISDLYSVFRLQFLEGLFQHTPHCRDFVALADGLECIGRFTALPCLPYDFANSVASDSIVQVMRTMTEVATTQTLLFLSKLVKASLEDTQDFWGSFEQPSKLLPLVDISGESLWVGVTLLC